MAQLKSLITLFLHRHWGGEGWCSCFQVPPLACEGPGHPRGGGSVQGNGCWAKRPALLLPVHPHGGHRAPHTRLHHLPPLPAASPQGGLCYQLVSDAHVHQVGTGSHGLTCCLPVISGHTGPWSTGTKRAGSQFSGLMTDWIPDQSCCRGSVTLNPMTLSTQSTRGSSFQRESRAQ